MSISIANNEIGYNNNNQNNNELELLPNVNEYNKQMITNEYEQQYGNEYKADNEYYDYENDFPIEGKEIIYSEKQNLLTKKHLFYLAVNRGIIPFFVYGALNALIVYGIYAFFNLYELELYWTININENMNDLSWILLGDLF